MKWRKKYPHYKIFTNKFSGKCARKKYTKWNLTKSFLNHSIHVAIEILDHATHSHVRLFGRKRNLHLCSYPNLSAVGCFHVENFTFGTQTHSRFFVPGVLLYFSRFISYIVLKSAINFWQYFQQSKKFVCLIILSGIFFLWTE